MTLASEKGIIKECSRCGKKEDVLSAVAEERFCNGCFWEWADFIVPKKFQPAQWEKLLKDFIGDKSDKRAS